MASSPFHSALIQIPISPGASALSGFGIHFFVLFWHNFYVLSPRANSILIVINYILLYSLFLVDMMDSYTVML